MIDVPHAYQLAGRAHGCDVTTAGGLFIDHVCRVAARVCGDPDPYAVVAALLHDTVEKGSFAWADLRLAGADDRLLGVVDALTERDGEADTAYLSRCARDPLALRIKRADIADKLHVRPSDKRSVADAARLRERARSRLELLERLADGRVDATSTRSHAGSS
jgi:hypothetical protein